MKSYDDDDIIAMLKAKNINITQPRVQILKIIFNLSETVFGAKLFLSQDLGINRISVHRALQLFVKNKILRKVPNTKGIMEYMIHDDFKSKRKALITGK